jgi:hypothetical protein
MTGLTTNLLESCTTDKLGRRSSIVKSGIFIFGLKSERNCSTGARAVKPARPVCVAKKKAEAKPLRPDFGALRRKAMIRADSSQAIARNQPISGR